MLHRVLGVECVIEWRAQMKTGLYSPVVDVAAGTFAIQEGYRQSDIHFQTFEKHRDLFFRLCETHLQNLNLISNGTEAKEKEQLILNKLNHLCWTNMNGRCFLAIEIENNVSRKHLMGGAINCSVLGKIGIAVGFTESKHKAFLNLYRYFDYLQSVDKPTFNTRNLLVISSQQLIEILESQLNP
jgi:hypothetical protein